MGEYSITFARSAGKELERLSARDVKSNLWRIRVGDYREIYSIDDQNKIVDITQVRHRSDAYR